MTLTVILANTWETYAAIVYENEWRPYSRRTVQIELTPEQAAKLTPRVVGTDKGKDVKEIILQCWIEPLALEGSNV